jgi:hypothetical protein
MTTVLVNNKKQKISLRNLSSKFYFKPGKARENETALLSVTPITAKHAAVDLKDIYKIRRVKDISTLLKFTLNKFVHVINNSVPNLSILTNTRFESKIYYSRSYAKVVQQSA